MHSPELKPKLPPFVQEPCQEQYMYCHDMSVVTHTRFDTGLADSKNNMPSIENLFDSSQMVNSPSPTACPPAMICYFTSGNSQDAIETSNHNFDECDNSSTSSCDSECITACDTEDCCYGGGMREDYTTNAASVVTPVATYMLVQSVTKEGNTIVITSICILTPMIKNNVLIYILDILLT